MTLRLYNTLTRRKEDFTPIDPSNVRMYVCGPTVYQRIHIGNARPLVVFDVLFRLLRHLYGEDKVTYVRNITDIDDKIVDQVRKDGVNGDLNAAIRDLTDGTTRAFHEDCEALGLLTPTHEPRATDHIPGMIRIIGELVDKGNAYAAEGHVLFHVPSMPAYGRLSGRSLDDMVAGARVEVAPYKRHPADFVLWKPSTPDLPGWDSPWGRGRPGWHIECSAMSEALLGVPFDIHGGGQDLIFPHHENEIAQSCCAHGLDTMANIWMHNGFIDMRGEKMSKSVGNVVRAWEALEAADEHLRRQGEIIRLWMLGTHYRQPIDFDLAALHRSKKVLEKAYRILNKYKHEDAEPDRSIENDIADDMNTPSAVRHLQVMTREADGAINRPHRLTAAKLRASGSLLGVLQDDPQAWLQGLEQNASTQASNALACDHNEEIVAAIEERRHARSTQDFSRADQIRKDLLQEHQVILEDRPDGTTDWRRA